jgi:hypothetical protein
MITVIDDKPRNHIAYVHALLYDDVAELTSAKLPVADGGSVTCLPGSVAFKAGFTDMKQLDHNGEWQDC